MTERNLHTLKIAQLQWKEPHKWTGNWFKTSTLWIDDGKIKKQNQKTTKSTTKIVVGQLLKR